MFGRLKFSIPVAMALTLLTMASPIYAETNSLPPARPGKLAVKAETADGTITFSWPTMLGKWDLLQKDSASATKWEVVPEDQYQTNGNIVSATVPLPKNGALYRVKRNVAVHLTSATMAPPLPETPTNRPALKPQRH